MCGEWKETIKDRWTCLAVWGRTELLDAGFRDSKRPRSLISLSAGIVFVFFFQAEDGIRDLTVTGVQTCALPIYRWAPRRGVRTPAPDRRRTSRRCPFRR